MFIYWGYKLLLHR